MASNLYEAWITRLRVSWMGANARRIFGGFAAALGDKSVDWANQGVLEHLPGYAQDPKSIALIADERQLDTYPGEPVADIAARAPYWLQINQFRGRGLGILLGLHFAGFDGAVLVQQNGRALQLSLPLPAFTDTWDPTPNLIVTPLSQLAVPLTSSVTAGHSAPAGHSWWTFDSDTDFCSRFAILFPSPPSPFITYARATLTGQSTAALTWNNPFTDANYLTLVCTPSGDGFVSAYVDGKTKTGATLNVSDAFTGTIDVIAWEAGDNPFCNLHAADLARLQSVVKKWRPAKATCVGVYGLVQGKFIGWPVQAQSANTMGPFDAVAFTQGF